MPAAQTAAGKAAQEVGPEDLGFPDRHAKNFAPTVTVDADGDDDDDPSDTAGPPNLHLGRVDPEVGPVAFDQAIKECLYEHTISSHSQLT